MELNEVNNDHVSNKRHVNGRLSETPLYVDKVFILSLSQANPLRLKYTRMKKRLWNTTQLNMRYSL